MKSSMKKTLAILLAAVTLLSLPGGVLALDRPAAEPPADLTAALSGLGKDADSARALLEQLAKDAALFLLGETVKLQTMNAEELNAYVDAIRNAVSTGSFEKLNALSEYVKRVLSEQETEGKTGLDALEALLLRAERDTGVSVLPKGAEQDGRARSAALLSAWLSLKLAWLAAAQLARSAGYPCSAALVDYAVFGQSYMELNGRFYRRIVKTQTYQDLLAEVKRGSKQLGRGYVLSHELQEDRDLFFALHSCTYMIRRIGRRYFTTVSDKFDFDLDFQTDNAFVSLVNSWGWLSTNTGVLREIDVSITFS